MNALGRTPNMSNRSKAGSVITGSRAGDSQRPSVDVNGNRALGIFGNVGIQSKLNANSGENEINSGKIAALQRMKRFEQELMAKQNTEANLKNQMQRVRDSTNDLKSVTQINTEMSGKKSNMSKHSKAKSNLVKYDADSGSCITFITDTSSLGHNPSSLNTYASSKMEMQLNFLAKQLELEKLRREKLQAQVEEM